jgi:glycosyltransferase EpsF
MAGKGEQLKNLTKFGLRLFASVFATHLAASSQLAASWMYGRRRMERDEVFYLPVARNLSEFVFDAEVRRAARAEWGVEEQFVVGHLGRCVPQKNHTFLEQTFAEVARRDPSSVMLLAGNGELDCRAKDLAASLGTSDRVHFLGRCEDASRLYQAMDVFVLPSLYEGVPGTGIEAQAAGLPLIYADAVTEEALLLPTTVREPLSSGPERWAELILHSRGIKRIDTGDVMEERGYGSEGAAKSLVAYYLKLLPQSGA